MEIRTVATLRRKSDEIKRTITAHERRLAQARADLASVKATIAIFEAAGAVQRLFRRGEAIAICKAALRQSPLKTRQLVLHIMEAKGMDTADAALAKAIASRPINALGQQRRRGLIIGIGKDKTARLWRLP
jgi:EAL domain-containing protein (putative c-di-GMP-specific phosphodiesterase class I)